MMTDAQLQARDIKRNIGVEMLQAAQELHAGKAARKTTFEPLPDGGLRRTVTLADGRWHGLRTNGAGGAAMAVGGSAHPVGPVAGRFCQGLPGVSAHIARVGAGPQGAKRCCAEPAAHAGNAPRTPPQAHSHSQAG